MYLVLFPWDYMVIGSITVCLDGLRIPSVACFFYSFSRQYRSYGIMGLPLLYFRFRYQLMIYCDLPALIL